MGIAAVHKPQATMMAPSGRENIPSHRGRRSASSRSALGCTLLLRLDGNDDSLRSHKNCIQQGGMHLDASSVASAADHRSEDIE